MLDALLSYDPSDDRTARSIIDAFRQKGITYREVTTLKKGFLNPTLNGEPFRIYLLVYSEKLPDERLELEFEALGGYDLNKVYIVVYRVHGSQAALDDFVLWIPDLILDGNAFPEGEGINVLVTHTESMLKKPRAKVYDLLVSSSDADRTEAQYLAGQLEMSGIRCWAYPKDAVRGEPREGAFCRALNQSDAYAYIFSRNSDANQYKKELMAVDILGIPVYFYRVDDKRLPLMYMLQTSRLKTIKAADDGAVAKLAKWVKR